MTDLDRQLHRLADDQPLADLRGPDLSDVRRRAHRRRGRQVLAGGLAVLAILAVAVAIPAALGSTTSHLRTIPGTQRSQPPAQRNPSAHRPGGLDPARYPPARSFPSWGLGSGCPATAGLEPVSRADLNGLLLAANGLGKSAVGDYRHSDRAFWPVVDDRWFPASQVPTAAPGPRLTATNTHIIDAAQSDVADLLITGCGAPVVQRSVAVVSCPATCSASGSSLNGTSIWLRRDGTWLLWFQR